MARTSGGNIPSQAAGVKLDILREGRADHQSHPGTALTEMLAPVSQSEAAIPPAELSLVGVDQ